MRADESEFTTATSRTSTFVMVDLAGYTALTETHGDEHAAHFAMAFAGLARSQRVTGPLPILEPDRGQHVLGRDRSAVNASLVLQPEFDKLTFSACLKGDVALRAGQLQHVHPTPYSVSR